MWKRIIAVAVVVGGLTVAWQLFSQEQPEPGGRQRGTGVQQRNFDPDRMRQMYLDRIKETLGATDEEWAVLAPRVEKVQNLSLQLRGGGGMGMFFGRRGGRTAEGAATEAPARELTEVEKALRDMRASLENENSTAEEMQGRLKALREAREKIKQEQAKAQDELRQILTVRQEAQLVLMGLLD